VAVRRPDDAGDNDLSLLMERYRAAERQLEWEGTFAEYFELVKQRPELAQLSHARVHRMIMDAGVTKRDDDSPPQYSFFSEELFGLDESLDELVQYFRSAARRMEVRKRILLLMGPPGGGKSTIIQLIKRGLERWTRTEEGAVYAIKGCPMHEDPLHLIPSAIRPRIMEQYGLYIEGELCPVCAHRVKHEYGGLIEEVPVCRVVFSENDRVGIGTFTPSDPKAQDISELTGSIDLATIGQYGVESDPRAYRFDGELNIANRGVMEFIEMLKAEQQFLYHLLTLSQEQNIKTGRFAMIYADEVVISHTNETEYRNFVADQTNEALHDRIIVVRVPYNLRVTEEERIYDKLIRQSHFDGVHIAPYTLRVASTFAVLTRLAPSEKPGMSLIKKLRLYDGEELDGMSERHVRELREESPREGMDGLSPRFIIDGLARAISKQGRTCINPLDALRGLRDHLDHHPNIDEEKKKAYLNLIAEARGLYDDLAQNEVQKAFVYAFEDNAQTLMDNYLVNIEAYLSDTRVQDPLTGEEVEPDEAFMSAIEEQIGVTDNARREFRNEILNRVGVLARRGQKFSYKSHRRLKEAIEKRLFADIRNIVKVTTSTRTPDEAQLKRINQVVKRLVDEHGYCVECANELLKYVGTLMTV